MGDKVKLCICVQMLAGLETGDYTQIQAIHDNVSWLEVALNFQQRGPETFYIYPPIQKRQFTKVGCTLGCCLYVCVGGWRDMCT